jgi:hypothetical protein
MCRMKTMQPWGVSASLAALSLSALFTQGCTPASEAGGNAGAQTGGQSGTGGKGSGGSPQAGSAGGSGGSGSGGSYASGGSGGSGSGTSGGSSGADGGSSGSGGAGTGGTGGGPDAATGTGGTDAAIGSDTPTSPSAGLGPWTGKDNVPPSKDPPGGLKPEQVPMLVSMGFDDNPYADGVNWVAGEFSKLKNPAGTGQAGTFDGTPARATFYDTSSYGGAAGSAWKAAYAAGFELGNHTVSHMDGSAFSEAQWSTEIKGCIDYHVGSAIGQKREDVWGFRTPQLRYNAATFTVVSKNNFWYDCSIEEGHQTDQDGTNFWWPYTLDSGSPGNATHPRAAVPKIGTNFPKGLWEMPSYRVIIPPDADAAKYGVPTGMRAKMMAKHPDGVGIAEGKITGLDYNLWTDYGVTKAEFVAILKYSLDQHHKGNRAPFLMGMHSFYYSASYAEAVPNATLAERRAAVSEFLNWAIATYPDVRLVTTKAVLDWIRNPVALKK